MIAWFGPLFMEGGPYLRGFGTMSGKSVMEMVWGTLLFICVTFISGLVLLCFWGMCSRDFLKFLFYAVIVMLLGLVMIDWCSAALSNARKNRENTETTSQRNSEMSMYFEGGTYFTTDGGTVTIQRMSIDDLVKLKKENDALRQRVRLAEYSSSEARFKLASAAERHQDECTQYRHLLNAAKAEIDRQKDSCRKQQKIDHLERMELEAWRKAEKTRKKRDARLRARVEKIRNQAKISAALGAAMDYAVAARAAWECDMPEYKQEVSNAVIALAEYLKPPLYTTIFR